MSLVQVNAHVLRETGCDRLLEDARRQSLGIGVLSRVVSGLADGSDVEELGVLGSERAAKREKENSKLVINS